MANPRAIAAALKAVPGGARPTSAPQGTGAGSISPVMASMLGNTNTNQNSYGPFLPRPSRQFTDGAFGPMSPINPVPVDDAPPGGLFADPRLWQYRVGWNLPTPPGTEGLKLASFDQLYTLSRKYSVARQCIELRIDEIQGLTWDITLTTEAAKAYQGDKAMMRDFGERQLKARKFFKRPDPDYFSFQDFMQAMLEEIFVYDALSLVLRPKYGAGLGRGLLGSDLDHIKLVSGPTIRPLLDMMGGHPRPPAPAYQQYLYGVPRSDYQTVIAGTDIDDYGLQGAEINMFRSDVMLYRPYWTSRESPYGFPPVERALLPIVSGLQKQEYQLDYFTEGTVPAVYISPGDPNITPTQIRELQDALNAIAGDPAYHMKVVVLPPGSKVEPQRPIDLSDSFDQLVQTQVCMAFDVQPVELGLLPNIGGANQSGPSASAIRFAGAEARDLKSRKSTKPLLKYICDIFNYIIQDVCNQPDMQFQFEGLVDDEDKQEITELGVQQVQNGIASIDEVRDRLDMPPWGLSETSEPVVFTAQGPIPFSMAPQLIAAMQAGMQGNTSSSSSNSSSKKKKTSSSSSSSSSSGSSGGKAQGTNSGQKTGASRSRTSQPSVRRGGQTKPNGSHPAPLSPHRESVTPGHAAAAGAIQGPGPRTGGTPNRSSVAGSRKKAVEAELDALRRHLRKGRLITTWDPRHINDRVLGKIAEDMAKGVLIDKAIEHAEDEIDAMDLDFAGWEIVDETGEPDAPESTIKSKQEWPGWEADLGLIGLAKERITRAFTEAEARAQGIRKDAVTTYSVPAVVLRGLISDEVKTVFTETLTPLWTKAWELGYKSASTLVNKDLAAATTDVEAFIATQGEHWAAEIARTGLGNNDARTDRIARTEVARAMNAGAMACYRANGVAYKHLLVAPDDTCAICRNAERDGLIPLDQSYSSKGGEPPFHPQCRCVSAPKHVEAIPPEAHLKKSDGEEDAGRCSFILLRAKSPLDGKWRYLLQQRDDGTWCVPGGTAHMGEDPFETAIRETTEEIGPIPPLSPRVTLVQNRPDKLVHIFMCETSWFTPDLSNLVTPEETMDARWFARKEIALLPLHKPFEKQWENINWKQVAKALAVNENGEVMIRDGGPGKPNAVGSNWPYPHRVDGSQETGWPDSGPGNAPASEPGSLLDSSAYVDDWAGVTNTLSPPPNNSDGEMPDVRGPAAERGKPTEAGGAPSSPPNPGDQSPATSVGATTGRPPGPTGKGMAPARGDLNPAAGQSLSGGPVPAETPHPYEPHTFVPVQLAPDGNECSVCNGPNDSPMHAVRPAKHPTVGWDDH